MFRRAAVAVVFAVLAAPTAAHADFNYDYEKLAQRKLTPPPLVFTASTGALAQIERRFQMGSSRSRSGYGMRLVNTGPEAVIALEGGGFKTVKAALRDHRRNGYKAVKTRIRGKSGYALTRKLGRVTSRVLLWAEAGRVYWLGTSTSKTVSLQGLRNTAAALDPLERAYVGSARDPETNHGIGGVLLTTKHTVSGRIEWSGPCSNADGPLLHGRGGFTDLVFAPRSGAKFTFGGTEGWSGTGSGVVSPGAITVTARFSGVFDGVACDTGSVTALLDKEPIRLSAGRLLRR